MNKSIISVNPNQTANTNAVCNEHGSLVITQVKANTIINTNG